MRRSGPLTEFEQMILLAMVRLGDEAYGVSICQEIEGRIERTISVAAAYTALERMEARGFVHTRIAESTPVRGGRAKKHFALQPDGAAALRESRHSMARMWEGLEGHSDLTEA